MLGDQGDWPASKFLRSPTSLTGVLGKGRVCSAKLWDRPPPPDENGLEGAGPVPVPVVIIPGSLDTLVSVHRSDCFAQVSAEICLTMNSSFFVKDVRQKLSPVNQRGDVGFYFAVHFKIIWTKPMVHQKNVHCFGGRSGLGGIPGYSPDPLRYPEVAHLHFARRGATCLHTCD